MGVSYALGALPALRVLVLLAIIAAPLVAGCARQAEFEEIDLYVVYKATEQDARLFVAGVSVEPLRMVKLFDSEGNQRMRWKGKNIGRLGHAELLFESPQLSLERVQEGYPAGVYYLAGRTVEGTLLVGETELSYELLDPPNITFPIDRATDVPTDNLVATWDQIAGAEAIRLELEDRAGKMGLRADLEGDATEFALPNGWLEPGVTYTMDVGAIAENGNRSVVDVRFTTAG